MRRGFSGVTSVRRSYDLIELRDLHRHDRLTEENVFRRFLEDTQDFLPLFCCQDLLQ